MVDDQRWEVVGQAGRSARVLRLQLGDHGLEAIARAARRRSASLNCRPVGGADLLVGQLGEAVAATVYGRSVDGPRRARVPRRPGCAAEHRR